MVSKSEFMHRRPFNSPNLCWWRLWGRKGSARATINYQNKQNYVHFWITTPKIISNQLCSNMQSLLIKYWIKECKELEIYLKNDVQSMQIKRISGEFEWGKREMCGNRSSFPPLFFSNLSLLQSFLATAAPPQLKGCHPSGVRLFR